MIDPLTNRLRMALHNAIYQCTEHNAEYHHRTSDQTISAWVELVRACDAAAALPSRNGVTPRRRLKAPAWQPLETAPSASSDGKPPMLLFKGHSKTGTFPGDVYISGWIGNNGEPVYDHKYKLKITGWKPLAMIEDEVS